MSKSADRRPILVVDDDAKIVKLVSMYLEREGYAVVTAADGPSALDAIREHNPRLVVLDLMLPRLDGRALMRAARGEGSTTPIIVLSARGSLADRLGGLADGADDYVAKPFSPAELMLRVKSVLRRTDPATEGAPMGQPPAAGSDGQPIVHADLVVDPQRFEVVRSGERIDLTRVEFRLLQVLLEADGRVLSRDQLMDAVYGADATEVMDRTIDVHVGRLRDKLADDPDDPRYIATVRGVGYRAAPSSPAR